MVSLLDQYHRLGKIESTLFQRLTSRFQSVALGADMTGAWRAPPPLAQAEAPAAAVTESSSVSAVDMRKPGGAQGHLIADESLRGRYRLGRVLERDAVGTVYEAIDQDRLDLPERNQKMAIKVVHKQISARVDSYNRLRLEFQDLQALSHPNILRVHEFDRDGDTVFFSMELLSGLPLSAVLSNDNTLPLERTHAATIIRQVGDTILYAHSRGVVHGDICPHNIFVTDEGGIRVLRFGASRSIPSELRASEFNSNQQPLAATTDSATDQALEDRRPEKSDDLYGIACLACVLWTGHHPLNNLSAAEARALRLKPKRPPGLSYQQWNAIRSALNFERDQRRSDIAKWLQHVVRRQRVEPLPILSVLLRRPRPHRTFSTGRAMILLFSLGVAVDVWTYLRFDSVADVVPTLDAQARRIETVAGSLVRRKSGAVRASTGGPSAKPGVGQSTAALLTPALEPVANTAPTPASAPPSTTIVSGAHIQAGTPTKIAPPIPPNNSPSRIELALETTEVSNNSSTALVLVRRKGNLLREATFVWWTETGTAKAGADFEPVAPRTETIKAGKDRINLQIPIVSDPTRRQTKNFFVVIDQPGPHVSLGARTAAKVSMLPSD